jgi:hypothetical protein
MGGVQVDERGEIGINRPHFLLRYGTKAKILVDPRYFELVTL